MKFNKKILLFILIQSALVANPFPLVAQELDEVVQRYIKSTWGETDINSIKSLRTFGFVQNEDGTPDFYIMQELKMPNLIKTTYFSEPNGLGLTVAYNGEVGWKQNTNKDSVSTERLSQERIEILLKDYWIVEPFIQPEKIGAEAKLTGKMKTTLEEYFQIIVTFRNGEKTRYTIDSKEDRLFASSDLTNDNSDKKYTNFSFFYDYRIIDGIYFSFLRKQDLPNGKVERFKVLRIEVNPIFSDNHFRML